MAHYAFLDENNVVTEVITGVDEHITQVDLDGTIVGGSSEAWETFYGNLRGQICKRTSYNGNYRKNFAGIGFTYDEEKDVFIFPKPFNSWILDEEKFDWKPPVSYPNDGKRYVWDEETKSWLENMRFDWE